MSRKIVVSDLFTVRIPRELKAQAVAYRIRNGYKSLSDFIVEAIEDKIGFNNPDDH